MIVKIDNRETSRHCSAVKYYKDRHTIIIEELPAGDFIFSDGKTEVVFEYKKFNDFKKSVKEGRMFDQALRQFKNFKYHFIIIEVEKTTQNQDLYNNMQSCEAIASLNTFTTVIICPSVRMAFRIMEKQAEHCLQSNPLEKRPYEKLDNTAYNYLLLIRGIDKITARAICRKLNLETFEDLKNVTTKQLTRVSGVGPITAQKITTSLKLN
jgi:ERCC4-type nuclease